jgi:predicted  nucleic acid-binding Zn-ribbon protein
MRDLITGAPGPDLERRIDDLERTVRDLRSELVSVRDRLERLEGDGRLAP